MQIMVTSCLSRRRVAVKCHLPLAITALVMLSASAAEGKPAPFHALVASAVEQAHAKLWNEHIDANGVILDFVGEIPTPEDCSLGRPNAIGWWSPIENGPFFTGLYLPAACERARRSGDPVDQAKARHLARGLLKCASVSAVPGFIARGMGTDGRCHYPLGSDDQTHPWFYGLHAYVTSGLAAAEERREITDKMEEVAAVLETTGWNCPCDGAFTGQFRGGFQGHLFRDAVRYLFVLRAIHEVTQKPIWLDRYRTAVSQRPVNCEKTRGEICAAGYPPDRDAIKSLDDHQLWIYVGSQASLAKLVAMETDTSLRENFRTGLALNATSAFAGIEGNAKFDNDDTKIFGHADWRKGFAKWFPQPTQDAALKLSATGDKTLLGSRKGYESRYMRNPLAAAAITALAGDGAERDTIERAIRRYDYAKLHMAELFFSECAYYALPPVN